MRPSHDRGSYGKYVQDILFGIHSLGFTEIDKAISVMSRRSIADGFAAGFIDPGPGEVRNNWDANIPVP